MARLPLSSTFQPSVVLSIQAVSTLTSLAISDAFVFFSFLREMVWERDARTYHARAFHSVSFSSL
jgi:hypothetical protein